MPVPRKNEPQAVNDGLGSWHLAHVCLSIITEI